MAESILVIDPIVLFKPQIILACFLLRSNGLLRRIIFIIDSNEKAKARSETIPEKNICTIGIEYNV